MARELVVNADDFGQSPGITRGIIRAFEDGIVTSASLMVRWPAAEEAAAYARSHPTLSLGLHIDFGEWAFRDDAWYPLYQVADPDDLDEAEAELERQLQWFRRLMGSDPTHVDSHQHMHRSETLRGAVTQVGRALGVPVRHFDARVSYCGDFYGMTGKGDPYPEAITIEALTGIISGLPEGVTELGCHPGEDDGTPLVYQSERAQELEVLCAPETRAAIARHGVHLRSFRGFASRTTATALEP